MKIKTLSLLIIIFAALLLIPLSINAKKDKPAKETKNPVHVFTIDKELKHTSVKDQYKTGTCWAHATLSFLESELIRTGKGDFDLSEMFIVRHTYPEKAWLYYRNHGNANFEEGGQAHDVFNVMKKYGIVTQTAYPGLNYGSEKHNHGEMFALLKGMLDGMLKVEGGKVTPRWKDAFEAVLDVYLGKLPEQFDYQGKSYTPVSFFKDVLQLNLDDYIELTSYNAYPFYQKCVLEVPDNWIHSGDYYNIPIDDLEKIIDYSINNGYTVAWDGDVSEHEFSSKKLGYAVVPAKEWDEKTMAEQDAEIIEPEPEKDITQDLRDKTFNDFSTTDDHLMHIVGLAHNQKNTKFYYTKNSGGTDRKYDGYVYMSRSYVRLKTLAIIVNKHALPPDIATKLGIK
jgi:bleomycin hydrolase